MEKGFRRTIIAAVTCGLVWSTMYCPKSATPKSQKANQLAARCVGPSRQMSVHDMAPNAEAKETSVCGISGNFPKES